jgi:uncharacterized protein
MANEQSTKMKQGDICHFELPVKDTARAKAFYSEIFGWTFQDMPDYAMFTTPGRAVGGGLFKPSAEQPPKVTNYLQVDSIDDTAKRIKGQGGKLITQKTEVAGHGSMQLFEDPEGNLMGLWQPTK